MKALRKAGCITEDFLSVDSVREFFSRFTIVFELLDGRIVDANPDFAKHSISEHFFFVMWRFKGFPYTPYGARVVARPEAQPKPKAKQTARREEIFGRFGTPPRRRRAFGVDPELLEGNPDLDPIRSEQSRFAHLTERQQAPVLLRSDPRSVAIEQKYNF